MGIILQRQVFRHRRHRRLAGGISRLCGALTTLQGHLGMSSALSHRTELPSGIRLAFMLQKGDLLASLHLCIQQGREYEESAGHLRRTF